MPTDSNKDEGAYMASAGVHASLEWGFEGCGQHGQGGETLVRASGERNPLNVKAFCHYMFRGQRQFMCII